MTLIKQITPLVEKAVKLNFRAGPRTHLFLSRAGSCLVRYLHYGLLVRITNKNNGASAVFAEVFSLTSALLQWFPAFWAINHLRIPVRYLEKMM